MEAAGVAENPSENKGGQMERKQLPDVTDEELCEAARVVRGYLRREEAIDEATAKRAGKVMSRYVTERERRAKEEARGLGVRLRLR